MNFPRTVFCAFAIGGMTALAPVAMADGPQAINTAATHAGLASQAGGIDMVHTHLHHVLNCLVGPGGDGFDAAPGNPCANAGGGAIPQTADAATKAKLQTAATQAKAGIANSDMAGAKKTAGDIQAMLK
jgi:hypothetical protein